MDTKESKVQIQSNEDHFNENSIHPKTDVLAAGSSSTIPSWIKQQEKAYTGWVNAHLRLCDMHIESLAADIAKVIPLISLLEALEKEPIPRIKKPYQKEPTFHCLLDDMAICLKFFENKEKKEKFSKFDAGELLKGEDIKIYLNLIWRLILHYSIETTVEELMMINEHNNPEKRLIQWCDKRLPQDIQNFTKDWSDGKAFAHLINQALNKNEQMSAEVIEEMEDHLLLEAVFELGHQYLQIPKLLDVKQIITAPNKKCIMTYVSLLHVSIEAKEREQRNADAIAVQIKAEFTSMEDQWKQRLKQLEDRVVEYVDEFREQRRHHLHFRHLYVYHRRQHMHYQRENEKLQLKISSFVVSDDNISGKTMISDDYRMMDMVDVQSECIKGKPLYCNHVRRIIDVLSIYEKWTEGPVYDQKANLLQSESESLELQPTVIALQDVIKHEMEFGYDLPNIIDDYRHMLTAHSHSTLEMESIRLQLVMQFGYDCKASDCHFFLARNNFRNIANITTETLGEFYYFDKNREDYNGICLQQRLDAIHCYFMHSFELMRLTSIEQKQVIENAQNSNDAEMKMICEDDEDDGSKTINQDFDSLETSNDAIVASLCRLIL